MVITSWNVNGLRAVAKKSFFDWLQTYRPDILCLQETKIQDDQLSSELRHIHGYESYFSFAVKKGYSGTAIYTRFMPDHHKTNSFPPALEGEGRIIELHFPSFVLLNVYFPNGQMSEDRLRYKLDFYDGFLDYIQCFQQNKKPIIITGDFNTAHQPIDLAEPDKNKQTSGFLPSERNKLDLYLKHGLIDIYRHQHPDEKAYTYWSYFANARQRNLGWRIDYFLISAVLSEKVVQTVIHPEIMGSDHCPLSIQLGLP